MESSSSAPVFLVPFARSVLDLLTVWPALQLSFEQSASHHSQVMQEQARSELATELVGAFLDAQPPDDAAGGGAPTPPPPPPAGGGQLATPDTEEIEDFLLGWIFGTLDVRIEDESEVSITRDLVSLWIEWAAMSCPADEPVVRSRGEVIQRVDRLAAGRRNSRARITAQVLDEGHISDDPDSQSEQGDDNMNIDHHHHPPQRHPSPTVDEDGFTLVTKSSQRH
ncbi:hypothetical protein PCANC_21873 [Puccinia coronata f. sp. avenae]|uniref:Pre-rRNA-processing protein TSR2 n=1 Tax=Puccinia coronata f. sp. avenae TaxID=200324 RepID=A0A2N5S0U0_9BASI|nr:hypothetical protein PCASD_23860 [Puccinia coronata f. sp. avenae]PLW08759.1 hypothetical protein PCANC_21873 [Puccinia coronata f. sp. avenae]